MRETDLSSPAWENGEPSYAAALALKNNIPYIGGECGKLKDRLDKRFTAKDLAGYYVILQIPYWSRMNPGKIPDFDTWFNELMSGLKKSLWIDPALEFTSDEFTRWYESKNHGKFEFSQINSEAPAPVSGENALFTQKMGFQFALLRDTNILQVITDMLNKFDRVLIVYGAGHYAAQKVALADMLGQPEYTYITDPKANSPDLYR